MKTHSNKNRVFELTFSSKQKSKLDMLVNTLQKTFKQSKRGSFDCSMFDEREYYFSVKGYKRVNALITLFVSQMPRIKYIITCIISEVVISFTTKTFCPKSVKL